MFRGVNKVILIGNLGNDPDVRSTPNGTYVATISLATNESWQDKQTGQRQERTEWHRVVFFDKLAEIVGQYLRKGSQIYVEGRLRTNKWQDKNTGQDRYSTEILARDMQMLGGRNESAGSTYGAQGGSDYSQYTPAPSGGYSAPPPANQGMGHLPYQPPYTEQPSSPSFADQSMDSPPPAGQPAPRPATAPNSPPPSKDFDEDVPF